MFYRYTWTTDEHEEDPHAPHPATSPKNPTANTSVHATSAAVAEDDRSEMQSGYRAIKCTLIPLPDATKHVTILLGPWRSEPCQNMTEDHTFLSG